MKIKGLKANLIPVIPEMLENKLEFRITTELTEEDILLYSTVLVYFDKQLKKDKVNLDSIPKTFAIFTDDGNIEISLSDTVLGINSNIIIYAIKRFEKFNLPEVLKVSVFLEELCHWAWNIEDEVEVKFKIFEILKEIYPGLKIQQVYPGLNND